MAVETDPAIFVAYAALLLLALVPIYLGSWKSVDLIQPDPEKDGKPELRSRATGVDKETLSTSDAYWFPITGSCVLFGLYLTFRFLDKDHVNMLLTAYFAAMGAYAVASLFADLVEPAEHALGLTQYELSLTKTKATAAGAGAAGKARRLRVPMHVTKFTKLTLVTTAVAIVLTGTYAATKFWLLNNLLGFAFSVTAIALMDLDGFKTGMVLLAGLFVYDVFWVFGTEVMVSVAKNFDAPVKMLWPKTLAIAPKDGFTMLGLGDIVIPGIYVALCLRMDYHNYLLSLKKRADAAASGKGAAAKKPAKPLEFKQSFATPYFTTCLVAYIAGLVTTVVVMHTFRAAQPALLYLSPACILASLATAAARGEFAELFSYSSEADQALKDALVPPPEKDSDESHDEKDDQPRARSLAADDKKPKKQLPAATRSASPSRSPAAKGGAASAAASPAKKTAAQLAADKEEAARKRKRLEAERFDFEEQTAPPVTKRVHAQDQANGNGAVSGDEDDGDVVEEVAVAERKPAPAAPKSKTPSPAKSEREAPTPKAEAKKSDGGKKKGDAKKEAKKEAKQQAQQQQQQQQQAQKQAQKQQQEQQQKPAAAAKKATPAPAPARVEEPAAFASGGSDAGAFQVVSRKKGKNARRSRQLSDADPAESPAQASEADSPATAPSPATTPASKASPAANAAATPAANARKVQNMLDLAAEFDL